MTASSASEFHPPWSRRMWYDSNSIYLEMPTRTGTPIVLKFDWTDDGLNKALKMMRRIAEEHPSYRGSNGWDKPHPVLKRVRSDKRSKGQEPTTEQRSIARQVLKKLGMI